MRRGLHRLAGDAARELFKEPRLRERVAQRTRSGREERGWILVTAASSVSPSHPVEAPGYGVVRASSGSGKVQLVSMLNPTRESAAERVYGEVKELILTNGIAGGELISEGEMEFLSS